MQNSELYSVKGTGIRQFTASIQPKPTSKPVYHKSRPVPYSSLLDVEREYDRLVDAGVLYPVTKSEWAFPAVHVRKAQGSVRVCGDYKAVNETILPDGYKLLRGQDLLARIIQTDRKPIFFFCN